MERDLTNDVEVRIVEATALRASLVVSLPREGYSPTASLGGCLYGPMSRLAETLPVRYALSDRSSGERLVGEVVAPEPCFWSAESPLYYELRLEVRDGEHVVRRTLPIELRPAQPPRLL